MCDSHLILVADGQKYVVSSDRDDSQQRAHHDRAAFGAWVQEPRQAEPAPAPLHGSVVLCDEGGGSGVAAAAAAAAAAVAVKSSVHVDDDGAGRFTRMRVCV